VSMPTANELVQKTCAPCDGGIAPLSDAEAEALLGSVQGWVKSHGGTRIRREWTAKDYRAAVDFFDKIARLAEREGHHPDLHLEGYRHVVVELWTHAIGGLSENDFILAAKIDQVPVSIRR
jgi:4a-hydroxytetrahydrobiopterin dehydratase